MKIVLIHGQNHKGSSYHIGRMIAEKAGADSIIAEFFLPRDLEHFCLGCYQCVEDETKCPCYNEKHAIMEQIEKADLLIFTTPTYCMRASAPMKAFIDLTFTYWMPHSPRKTMFGKKAIVVSTAAGTGMKSAIKDITNTLFYWGVPCVKSYGAALQASNWGEVSDKKKEKIERDTTKLAKSISAKKPKVGIKTKAMFSIMRMMIKTYDDTSAEKRYWNDNGWLDKDRPWK
ncbi:MAG: NAD(P)H-dependent oxidoreductase [Eubacterium sp.]|nr:NAD(P)H-dependent oxidoreductase [Eubacterium sp.]